MTTLAPGTVVEIRPQGFVKGVMMVKGPKGDDGGPGPANTLAIGTVTTSAPGGSAAATITGAAPDQTLDLTIPRGAAGPTTEERMLGTSAWTTPTWRRTHRTQVRASVDVALHVHRARKA